jgi:hypothetical protein
MYQISQLANVVKIDGLLRINPSFLQVISSLGTSLPCGRMSGRQHMAPSLFEPLRQTV